MLAGFLQNPKCLLSGLIIISLTLLAGCGGDSSTYNPNAERPDFAAMIDPASVSVDESVFALGKRGYVQACYTCHGSDGMGMPGMQPALIGSKKLISDPYWVIEWVLRGSASMRAHNSTWPTMMPGHKHLSDKEIAAIISYTRNEFGSGASPVSPEMVELVRDAL